MLLPGLSSVVVHKKKKAQKQKPAVRSSEKPLRKIAVGQKHPSKKFAGDYNADGIRAQAKLSHKAHGKKDALNWPQSRINLLVKKTEPTALAESEVMGSFAGDEKYNDGVVKNPTISKGLCDTSCPEGQILLVKDAFIERTRQRIQW